MHINIKQIAENNQAQTLQLIFNRMSLKTYFETLSEMFDDETYINGYKKLLRCTSVNSEYRMLDDPRKDSQQYINEQITVGEMLKIARKLLMHDEGPQWPADPIRRERVQNNIACTIMEMVLVQPLIAVSEMLHKKEQITDTLTKG